MSTSIKALNYYVVILAFFLLIFKTSIAHAEINSISWVLIDEDSKEPATAIFKDEHLFVFTCRDKVIEFDMFSKEPMGEFEFGILRSQISQIIFLEKSTSNLTMISGYFKQTPDHKELIKGVMFDDNIKMVKSFTKDFTLKQNLQGSITKDFTIPSLGLSDSLSILENKCENQ